jgi:hypothetical protein
LRAIEPGDNRGRFVIAVHLHEAKASGLTSISILDDRDTSHLSKGSYGRLEALLCRLA